VQDYLNATVSDSDGTWLRSLLDDLRAPLQLRHFAEALPQVHMDRARLMQSHGGARQSSPPMSPGDGGVTIASALAASPSRRDASSAQSSPSHAQLVARVAVAGGAVGVGVDVTPDASVVGGSVTTGRSPHSPLRLTLLDVLTNVASRRLDACRRASIAANGTAVFEVLHGTHLSALLLHACSFERIAAVVATLLAALPLHPRVVVLPAGHRGSGATAVTIADGRHGGVAAQTTATRVGEAEASHQHHTAERRASQRRRSSAFQWTFSRSAHGDGGAAAAVPWNVVTAAVEADVLHTFDAVAAPLLTRAFASWSVVKRRRFAGGAATAAEFVQQQRDSWLPVARQHLQQFASVACSGFPLSTVDADVGARHASSSPSAGAGASESEPRTVAFAHRSVLNYFLVRQLMYYGGGATAVVAQASAPDAGGFAPVTVDVDTVVGVDVNARAARLLPLLSQPLHVRSGMVSLLRCAWSTRHRVDDVINGNLASRLCEALAAAAGVVAVECGSCGGTSVPTAVGNGSEPSSPQRRLQASHALALLRAMVMDVGAGGDSTCAACGCRTARPSAKRVSRQPRSASLDHTHGPSRTSASASFRPTHTTIIDA
jgi:hypothetical protein